MPEQVFWAWSALAVWGRGSGCLRRFWGYLLQARHEHHGGEEEGPLLDLPAEPEDGVLLEPLPDVQDVLVLERDEADLLQTSPAGLLDKPDHRLGDRDDRAGRREKNKTIRNIDFNLQTTLTWVKHSTTNAQ